MIFPIFFDLLYLEVLYMESRDSRRSFTQTQKNEILYQQNNKCAKCHKKLDIRIIQYDHIKAWADTGRTITQNGAALHPDCHALKTHIDRVKKIDKQETSIKPASSETLKKLNIKQLKILAQKHKIVLRGKTSGNFLYSEYVAPTKSRYVEKLSGQVTEKEMKSLLNK
jgi:hypothetical protein